jgi:hypothetical protein
VRQYDTNRNGTNLRVFALAINLDGDFLHLFKRLLSSFGRRLEPVVMYSPSIRTICLHQRQICEATNLSQQLREAWLASRLTGAFGVLAELVHCPVLLAIPHPYLGQKADLATDIVLCQVAAMVDGIQLVPSQPLATDFSKEFTLLATRKQKG